MPSPAAHGDHQPDEKGRAEQGSDHSDRDGAIEWNGPHNQICNNEQDWRRCPRPEPWLALDGRVSIAGRIRAQTNPTKRLPLQLKHKLRRQSPKVQSLPVQVAEA
jgi:hypothetical protein